MPKLKATYFDNKTVNEMQQINFPINIHDYYHAHVYFDQATLALATDLCKRAGDSFALKIGRVHQKTVGPHPKWSCQITFSANDFAAFIPWLEANRQGLSVLVHALTGEDLKDHTEYAYWLGNAVDLNLDIFRV